MRDRLRTALLSLAAILTVERALANDSVAELRAGGIVLARTDAIKIVSEDLHVTPRVITVRYRFRNLTSTDQRLRVAFPMPDLNHEDMFNQDLPIPDPNNPNFMKFQSTADGAPISFEIEQRAFVRGRDITNLLRSSSLPLLAQGERARAALRRLTAEQVRDLVEAKAIEVMGGENEPRWVLRSTMHREQVFPAGRELLVEHRYQPGLGASVDTGLKRMVRPTVIADYRRKWCTDQAFINGVDALERRQGEKPIPEMKIAYVLITAANWAGPIDNFRLRVELEDKNAILSTCFEGIRKLAPGIYEANHKNFTPRRDLDLLLLNHAWIER